MSYQHSRGFVNHTRGNGAQSKRSQRQQCQATARSRCCRCGKIDDTALIAQGNDLGCRQVANRRAA